ncbi:conserved hypothetical protein [Talaromyces stipitatus ATCC 10500]|uniref:Integrase catalytic domain-containing protein n=1 Tax=Talaromyces stipitatus (strain ATCC 10500 / CBS 375.48 / QM 6759 / NRRL 1006) TaxID=441959 RepID=B8LUX2_TALSN|nr:uncharacterized protein TSTA_060850 [Talaromyces stipitatus ATCC 10500]EED22593.1 conserved hypothetical protein [Talaromyces stipitatus ATCC 10500]
MEAITQIQTVVNDQIEILGISDLSVTGANERAITSQLDSGAAKLDRGRAYLVQQPSSLQPPPQPLPLLAPPPPQANFSSSQSQSSESNAYSYPSHLLLTRASYINSEIRQQDYLSWILDSGATQHFCNSKLDLKDYKHFLEPREIYLGDNTTIYAEGSGTQHLQVGPYILVLNVWFVPKLAENLLSLQLLDRAGYSTLIENGIVYIRQQGDSNSAWFQLANSKHGDLYRMHISPSSLVNAPRALRTREFSTLRLWHNRLGHRNFRSVGDLMNLSVPRQLPTCTACLQGKMKADSHPPVLERCSKSFDRVHANLIPLDGISLGGSKYMLLLVDDYTRYAWCYFASSKNVPAITPLLQGFINLVLTQFNAVIKSWRTDGGTGEFINSMVKEINRQYGILHQVSTSGVKQQNDVLERRVQTIKNIERSMRAGAGVLDDYRLQAESLATSVFLTNILPSTTLDNISPHLLLYKKQPPLTTLKPWGCLVWIHLRKEHRSSSSDPRCRPAMMVGYIQDSKSIYKCLDLHTLQTSNHSEIKFDEDLFPGPWLKRPAGFKLSIAHKRNPPGSAVDTVLGQSVPGALPNVSSVPFSSMNPFWLQQSQPPADPVNPEDPAKPVDPMELADVAQRALDSPQSLALRMDSQPIYNPRGSVVFGTYVKIHEHDTTRELVEAALIVQGMESLSCPPWQTAERIQTDHNGDPLSYSDALLQDPIRWPPVVQEELKSHEENGTWIVQEISQMPKGCKPIPGKWVFKRKPSPDEGIRYKARLVIKGFLQRFGVDFMETYAPTASLAAFRLLVAIAVHNGWSLRNLDIITAFLNGNIDSEVYMGIPEGIDLDPKKYVLKLRRSLYGLKQAPRI